MSHGAFILKQIGSRWEVWVDTDVVKRMGGSKARKALDAAVGGADAGEILPIYRNAEGKLAISPGTDAKPARFDTKGDAEHVAHMLGNYKFGLGSFVHTYIRVERVERDRARRDCIGVHTHDSRVSGRYLRRASRDRGRRKRRGRTRR